MVRWKVSSLLCVLATLSVAGYAQEKYRTITQFPVLPDTPIAVVDRRIDGKSLEETKQTGDIRFATAKRGAGERDWLKKLELYVQNVSDKKIVYFRIELKVWKTKNMPMNLSIPVEYRSGASTLAPRDVATVRISDAMFNYWIEYLKQYQVDDLDGVTVDIRRVIFEDSSNWVLGNDRGVEPLIKKKTKLRPFGWGLGSRTLLLAGILPVNYLCNLPPPAKLPTGEQPCGYWDGAEFGSECSCTNAYDEEFCWRQGDEEYSDTGTYGYIDPEPYACVPPFEMPSPSPTPYNLPTCNSCLQGSFTSEPPRVFGHFTQGARLGATEYCDQMDNDCDGAVDEDNVCCPGINVTPQMCEGDYPVWSYCRGCCVNEQLQCDPSPIIIDVGGNGISLTSANNGVDFDLNSDGTTERLAWTYTNSDDGWLVLDRNTNGTIDNGTELFGNFTEQPTAPPPGEGYNGFLALAVYDRSENGGNNDRWISEQDEIFVSLRIWQDRN